MQTDARQALETEENISINPKILELFPGASEKQVLERAFRVRQEAIEKEISFRCIEGLIFLREGLYSNTFFEEAFRKENMKNLRVLEIGTGFGLSLRCLAKEGISVENIYGVDISEIFLELGFHFMDDKAKFGDRFRVMDALEENFVEEIEAWAGTDRPFDVIVANLVLHILPGNNEKFVQHVSRLLRPGGAFLGQTFGVEDYFEEAYEFGIQRKAVMHSPVSLSSLFNRHGLDPVHVDTKGREIDKDDFKWIEATFGVDMRPGKPKSLMSFIGFRR
ncbi:hypothetical protein Gasu2_28190 [Galdieria sulphuraria]|uniref:Methyltransferase type 12 domain-containing protein n=1 Tax=Galdieria sulphuraria TaxID=130081 RepID=M2WX25_GALSU|nr:uncharacterized protein Gasu_39420 [Galdieria sulphuraria]EME28565.1 hypothetical protein Gasu_39420 [Galdieria sulphuraria]GJD08522.1 hypothetical protein Gasu2_28190 [Galdieria sulphuraria]|eukprot:XP_005705085.1 hypothetical protein Gasu_39420 [Galdieria sulphuraria]